MLDDEKETTSLEPAAAAVDAAALGAGLAGAVIFHAGATRPNGGYAAAGAALLIVCMAVFMADLYRISLALQRESKGDQEGMED